ncbi:2-amino-4-hydroxy-6-hydroxymethyldihydropteridine diphosphokinase [Xanthobacter sp. TB0139]|uniref:2-amino-4-hydroxy-6- hydroxymethyldihydropteridine diphosphokinase n=1 Tax=Xanthobacter sp. TB0139 TaxID=3459178 RepID=UPI00403A006A
MSKAPVSSATQASALASSLAAGKRDVARGLQYHFPTLTAPLRSQRPCARQADMAQPVRAYLGLGSNMGDKSAMIAQAIRRLDATPGITIIACSSDYHTPPWGDTDQDWFVNACVAIDTTLSPFDLLEVCLTTEKAMGRTRLRKWGPRNIDIDLLDHGGQSINTDRLTLPHPFLLERDFVLLPLAEIAGELRISGRNIGELAGRITDTSLVRA